MRSKKRFLKKILIIVVRRVNQIKRNDKPRSKNNLVKNITLFYHLTKLIDIETPAKRKNAMKSFFHLVKRPIRLGEHLPSIFHFEFENRFSIRQRVFFTKETNDIDQRQMSRENILLFCLLIDALR